jgi:hypothetical protein
MLMLVLQNDLFCARQLRNGEYFRGAPIGGSGAYKRCVCVPYGVV